MVGAGSPEVEMHMSPSYYLQAAQLEKMGAWDLVSWAFGREHLNLEPSDFKSLFRHFQFQDDILFPPPAT